jgi:hypothetical protein
LRRVAVEFCMSRSAVREELIRLDTLRIIESRLKSGRHLKGVDTYFRMFFSEGPGAEAGAPPAATSSGRVAPGKGKPAPARPKRAATRGGTAR